ncbi:MAG TPA: Na-translocating system protein MpsC family protein [Thermoleophilaceae bacterium]|nr:Na-translocating system protein MpsC family protein [Thermoleophilaceae bacterium]
MSATQVEHATTGPLAAAISNGVVHLVLEYTGRGPTRARTHITDELISVVLEDTLTKGERSLVEDGKTALVLDARKAYQQTMRRDLIAMVEEATGRKVRAFLSDNHMEPDVAIESFLLEPQLDEHRQNGGAPPTS